MKNMKRFAAILMAVILFTQACPVTALAQKTGAPLTSGELQRALEKTGLVRAETASGDENAAVKGASSDGLELELPAESGYHPGMTPDESWDAQMLMDWVDDIVKTDIYDMTDPFVRTQNALETMKEEAPDLYEKYTAGNEERVDLVYTVVKNSSLSEGEAVYFRNRLEECLVTVDQNLERLTNEGDELFDSEIALLSEQVREATAEIEELTEDMIGFALAEAMIVFSVNTLLEGGDDPAFPLWMQDILDYGTEPEEVNVRASAVQSTGYNTRLSRISGGASVLAATNYQDVTIQVISKDDFLIKTVGKEGKPVGGVEVTVTDLNNNYTETKKTQDTDGIAAFDSTRFKVNDDQEMELELAVNASAQGYRDFYVARIVMKQGGSRTEQLVPLAREEEGSTRKNPYLVSASFNGYDILRQDKKVICSYFNTNEFEFRVVVDNPDNLDYEPPVLHFWKYVVNEDKDKHEVTMKPTGSKKLTSTHVQYTYKAQFKKIMSAEIVKEERPFFTLKCGDKEEKTKTLLNPVRSAVEKPTAGPLAAVIGNDSWSLKMEISKLDLEVELTLPIDRNKLPNISFDPNGYVSVTWGSPLLEDNDFLKKLNWKNDEAERYKNAMRQYEHAMGLTDKKNELVDAYKYYKKADDDGRSTVQKKRRVSLGWFFTACGRKDKDADDGSRLWALTGMIGGSITFKYEYTKPFMLGPVPFYAGFTLSLSAGAGLGFGITLWLDKNLSIKDGSLDPVREFSLQVKFNFSVIFGMGIKGVASIYAKGGVNFTFLFQWMIRQQKRWALTFKASLTVGAELWLLTIERVMIESPKKVLINNGYYNGNNDSPINLLTSYALADEAKDGDSGLKLMEPQSYPALAPEAKAILTRTENTRAGVRAVATGNGTYAFYIGDVDADGTRRRLCWVNADTGAVDSLQKDLKDNLGPFGTTLWDKEDFSFDVVSSGSDVFVFVLCGRNFDDNGLPAAVAATDQTDKLNEFMYYAHLRASGGKLELVGKIQPGGWFGGNRIYYSRADNPRLQAVNETGEGKFRVCGAMDGYDAEGRHVGYNVFFVEEKSETDRSINVKWDARVADPMGAGHERTALFANAHGSNYRSSDDSNSCYGFISLSRPVNMGEGASGIELYDYDMNVADFTNRKAVLLTQGNILSMSVLQTLDDSGVTQTVFYNETVASGKKVKNYQNRLKSIRISPKQGTGTNNISFDLTYTDYDLSLPVDDFQTAEISGNQYLYWVTSNDGEGENGRPAWRINAVYYDPVSNSMCDEMVIAEFTLPDMTWEGKSHQAVPCDVLLTDSGVGFIAAKPDLGAKETDEEIKRVNTDEGPLTLYSFPLNLKPVITMKAAALMDYTVNQGSIVTADFTLMNEGNVGVTGFDIDVIQMQGDKELQLVETIHYNALNHKENKLTMLLGGKNEVVTTEDQAFYRYNEFQYSPKQRDWIVKTKDRRLSVANGSAATWTENGETGNHLTTEIMVPGATGSYGGQIKIPNNWKGSYVLRLKVTKLVTNKNWLSTGLLNKSAGGEALNRASADGGKAAEDGELVYVLDEASGRMVLQQPEKLNRAGEGGVDETNLYAMEIPAPQPVDIDCNVHDIDISHRMYFDYNDEEMIEITISDYYANEQNIELTCAVYKDDAETPEYVSLPYDPKVLAADRTTTINMPLKSLVDPDSCSRARIVILGRTLDETAYDNNEFDLWFSGEEPLTITEQPQDAVVPAGTTASFTVGVSGGSRPYTYQWQVWLNGKWENVDGGNQATLQLLNVKKEWSGNRYRVIVTDAKGRSVTSREAKLTVTGKMPATGDNSNLPLYLATALLAIGLMLFMKRKEKKRG